MGIAVIGTTFMDVKGYPLDTYIPAGRNAGRVAEVHGGVSRNIAEDMANVGFAPTFVSSVDDSGLSADIIARLDACGCDTRFVRSCENGLGMWLAIFDETGDVVASISRRSNLSSMEQTLAEDGDEIISQADAVCIEYDVDVPILERTLELAERHGKRVYAVVSNMTIACERRDLLRKVTCLVCNQQEAGILFSRDLDEATPEQMLGVLGECLSQTGLASMVVTMGAQGSVFASVGGESGWCPAHMVEVVDTTGAGDAFFAGTALGLTYGDGLEKACEIGTALSASVITTEENVCGYFSPEELGLEISC